MSYDELRAEIAHYDELIKAEIDVERKVEYLEKDIGLLKEYINFLRKGRRVRIVWCVLLSILLFMGLVIFLPGIIIRTIKLNKAHNKMVYYLKMKADLVPCSE